MHFIREYIIAIINYYSMSHVHFQQFTNFEIYEQIFDTYKIQKLIIIFCDYVLDTYTKEIVFGVTFSLYLYMYKIIKSSINGDRSP